MNRLRLNLLGGFRLDDGQGREVEVSSRKNRALLAILSLAPQGEVTRGRLTGLLWSDRGEEQARASVRQALMGLRKQLAQSGGDAVVLKGDRVALDRTLIVTDVAEFLEASASVDASELRRAADLYAGPLLDGLDVSDNAFEDWLREARNDLASRAAGVLETLGRTVAAGERMAVAEKLVALDPLREASHRTLIKAYADAGEGAKALKQYEACKLILKRELGVAPGPELEALHRSITVNDAVPERSSRVERRPVIAVLPFENLSGDPAQQYFSDGVTEEIIDRLSRYRILSVLGSHSTFSLRGREAALREVRDRLSADYVLTGGIRRSDSRIRIAARLTDVGTGATLWADHYDRPLTDVFAVQDDVTALIASTLMGRVEIEVATRSPLSNPAGLSSYEHVLEGIWHFNKLTPASNATAAACFERAIACFPQNAEAHRWLASCLNSGWLYDFSTEDLSKSLAVATRGVELDLANAGCHAVLGFSRLFAEGVQSAIVPIQTALSLNPGDPNVLIEAGLLRTYSGDVDASRQFFDQAFRLNPLPPIWYTEFRAVGGFVAGHYADVLPAFAAIPEGAWDVMYTLSCMGHLGLREGALRSRLRFQAAGRNWDLLRGASAEPYLDPEPRLRLIEGLEKALSF